MFTCGELGCVSCSGHVENTSSFPSIEIKKHWAWSVSLCLFEALAGDRSLLEGPA